MKRFLNGLTAFIILIIVSGSSSQAQVNVSVNIGAQPMWGPAGYDAADYYYLPDIECYYYVPRRQFVYMNGPNWVFSANLPARCRNYDLYSGYKVVCSGPRPYSNFSHDRVVYANYRGYRGRQPVIRDYRGRGGYYYAEGRREPGGYRHNGGYDRGGYEHPGRGGYEHYEHDHDRGHGRGRW